jgi:hypothetical protein
MTLTNQQLQAFQANGSVPVVIDGVDCVVVRADVFEKVKSILDDGLTHDELRAMLAHSAQNSDWLHPAMDIYDRYDEHR